MERDLRVLYETGLVPIANQRDDDDLPPNLCRVVQSRRFGPGGW